MSKMQEALGKVHEECYAKGWRDRIPASDVDTFTTIGPSDAIDAAEAAVLALYEAQKAIADELAEAVRSYIEDDDATVGELKAALAAYNKAKS